MENTSLISVSIDNSLKEMAESIMSAHGISPADAILTLYIGIVMGNGKPFEYSLDNQVPIVMRDDLTPEEFNEELKKGLKSIDEGRIYSQEEVDAMLAEIFGI